MRTYVTAVLWPKQVRQRIIPLKQRGSIQAFEVI